MLAFCKQMVIFCIIIPLDNCPHFGSQCPFRFLLSQKYTHSKFSLVFGRSFISIQHTSLSFAIKIIYKLKKHVLLLLIDTKFMFSPTLEELSKMSYLVLPSFDIRLATTLSTPFPSNHLHESFSQKPTGFKRETIFSPYDVLPRNQAVVEYGQILLSVEHIQSLAGTVVPIRC